MQTIVNFINKNWRVIFTFFGTIFVIYIVYNVSEKSRIQDEIASIDSQLTSHAGRLSPDDYTKLLAKKKALLNLL